MSDEGLTQTPAVFSSKERAALVAKALSEAARRARFSTKRRRSLTATGFRARRGERLFKLLRVLSFLLVVVIPVLAGAGYLFFVASDQYTAEARFTLRGGLPPKLDGLGSLAGAPGMLIVQDTQIVMNYLVSRTLVETLNGKIDLAKLYQLNTADWLARLKQNPSIEKEVGYWKHQVDLSVQLPSGVVVMTVKAFTPQDAVTIADAAISASEFLVNDMNEKMQADAVQLAETERKRAQDSLARARAGLERARNEEGILNAKNSSIALVSLMTDVQGQQIRLQQDYDSQRRFVRADAPQLKALQTKIDAATIEINKLQEKMTQAHPSSDAKDGTLSGSISRLDYAALQSEIAEKIYAGSIIAVERARIASETKLMYINTFVQPVAAQEAKYPKRALDMAILSVGCLAAWAAVLGLLTVVRGNLG